jgi:hypothetical protein
LKSIEPVGLVFDPLGIFKSLSVSLPLSQSNLPLVEAVPPAATTAAAGLGVAFLVPLNSIGIFAIARFGNILEMTFAVSFCSSFSVLS